MTDPDPSVWEAMLAHIRRHHPTHCRLWFEDIEPIEVDGGVIRLFVPRHIHLKYLQSECTEIFNDAAQTITNRLVVVKFVGDREKIGGQKYSKENRQSSPDINTQNENSNYPAAKMRSNGKILNAASNNINTESGTTDNSTWDYMYDEMVLNPDYSFENFVVGPTNRLAHAAAIAVSQRPGLAYNPYFIHGGVGLGKTHLLQAICQSILQANSNTRIYYTSCDAFLNKFIESVQAGEMINFRHYFRNVDILVVDDIHDLAGHERSQEEFFHTFNCLHQQNKQIVLSSDAPPQEIPHLEARLVSRFKQGLVARIDIPCYETRIGILKQKAALRDLKLPVEVICHIAQEIDSNIRELEGALTQLQGLAMATGRLIDMDLAQEALGKQSTVPSPLINVQEIMARVCQHYDIKQSDLLSKRRHRSIAFPRQVAMYLARRHTEHSLEEVGGYFGGRDHTTVMHAERKILKQRQLDDQFDHLLTALEKQLSTPIRARV